jgi:hypothetical protein
VARTTIPISQLVGNGGLTVTPTAIDIANGMTVPAAWPEATILVVTNTDTNPHTVTVPAGDPVGGTGSWPNQTFSVPASSFAYIGPFESAKVQQIGGSLSVNFVSGHTGTITALRLPKGI